MNVYIICLSSLVPVWPLIGPWPLLSTASSIWSASIRAELRCISACHGIHLIWPEGRHDEWETLLWVYCYSNPALVPLMCCNIAEVLIYETKTGRLRGLIAGWKHQIQRDALCENRRRLKLWGGFSEVFFWMCSLIKWHKSSRCLQDATQTQLLRLTLKCHIPWCLQHRVFQSFCFLTLHGKIHGGKCWSMSCGLFHDVMRFNRRKPSEKVEWRHLLLARCFASLVLLSAKGTNAFFCFHWAHVGFSSHHSNSSLLNS